MSTLSSNSNEGQAIVCRAALCRAPKRPLTVEMVTIDPPKAGEVRIKVVATGVCHSDAHLITGHLGSDTYFPVQYPVLLGHEGSGIVESIGEGVTTVVPGDHVLMSFLAKCNKCLCCTQPERTNYCTGDEKFNSMPDGTLRTRTVTGGEEVYNFAGLGTLADYVVTRESRVAKISKEAPLEKVCLLSCGVPTGYGSAVNIAKVRPGSAVGIWGLGTIGLAAACGARACGATKIIGVDTNPAKFELAKKFGCTHFVNPLKLPEACATIVDAIKSQTDGIGLDYAIECIGFQKTLQDAYDCTAAGYGVTVLNGLIVNKRPIEFDAIGFTTGKTVTGGLQGGYQGRNDLPKLVDLYMEGKLMVDEFITGTMKLDQVNEAFDLLLSGKALRTVVLID